MFKTTYPNINIRVLVHCVLDVGWKTYSLQQVSWNICLKNKSLLVQKLQRKKLSKSVSGHFRTKRKGLLSTNFFLAASLIDMFSCIPSFPVNWQTSDWVMCFTHHPHKKKLSAAAKNRDIKGKCQIWNLEGKKWNISPSKKANFKAFANIWIIVHNCRRE